MPSPPPLWRRSKGKTYEAEENTEGNKKATLRIIFPRATVIFMAEEVGFEPTRQVWARLHALQACAFDLSATPPHSRCALYGLLLAERVGFEPTGRFSTAQTISSRPPSTARPPLRIIAPENYFFRFSRKKSCKSLLHSSSRTPR